LGMLKAVQSSEPRWLRIEDELGAKAPAEADVLEHKIMRQLHHLPPRSSFHGWKWVTAVAVLVLFGLLARWWPQGPRELPIPSPSAPSVQPATGLAVLIQLDGVEWESGEGSPPAEGSVLTSGPLRLRAGRATLAFYNGVTVFLEGPAEVDLVAVDNMFCHRGKLRTRVPPGAEGFTVVAPGMAVVDLGTEFALNIEADGKGKVMVFEGNAEVSLLNAEGAT